jgi:hypothetical protein
MTRLVGMSMITANETMVPLMPCLSVEDTQAFFESLGFRVTYSQARPYPYLAVEWGRVVLHFGAAPKALDPADNRNGALVMVDDVAPYHAAIVAAMRATHGKVLSAGQPRVTRLRTGASRFTLVDPSGNNVIFIRRDEPAELEYGGSAALAGLAKVLDNARIYRDFKNDDRAALRALMSGLRKHGATATAVERTLTYATLIDLATALGEPERIPPWRAELDAIELTDEERAEVETRLADAAAEEPPSG